MLLGDILGVAILVGVHGAVNGSASGCSSVSDGNSLQRLSGDSVVWVCICIELGIEVTFVDIW